MTSEPIRSRAAAMAQRLARRSERARVRWLEGLHSRALWWEMTTGWSWKEARIPSRADWLALAGLVKRTWALESARLRSSLRWRVSWVELLEGRQLMAGLISGWVFQDFNANGVRDVSTTLPNASGVGTTPLAVDRGLGGIVVTAFDASNTVRGTTSTATDGTYAFTPSGVGPYRLEFTNLPLGYFVGPVGADSRTLVRFLPDSGDANVSLGLVLPNDYTQNNPDIVTTCFVYGDQINGPNAGAPVIVSFPYTAGSNSPTGATSYTIPTTHALAVPASQVGTTWGLGYDREGQTIYAAAYMRRHAGYGPSGTGAIYAIDRTNGSVTLFADLNAIFGVDTAGPNAHDVNDYDTDNGNIGWDAVGKTSLGGLEVSPDGSTVYVMNLADRSLYAIPTSGPIDSTTVRRETIPLNAPGATGVNGGDLRPFAVQYHQGRLHVGVVNTAESTGQTSDLFAYVYTVDPTTLQFSTSPVFQMALNYPRSTPANSGSPVGGAWQPWVPTYLNLNNGSFGINPQPMLSGLSFDVDGNLVLAFRDRFGDQVGSYNLSNPNNPAQRVNGVSTGDTLRAFLNTPGDLNSGWTLENNGRGPAGQGIGPQNTGAGPGGAEFYYQDNNSTFHAEITIGASAQIPGAPDAIVNAFDPGLSLRTGGPIWLTSATGSKLKAYQLFNSGDITVPDETFGKSNGLGDLSILANLAEIQLGDRIFRDDDRNGLQDPGEPGIAGVTVRLYQGASLVATTTTDTTGNYLFSAANVPGGVVPLTDHTIRLDNPADFSAGGPLFGLSLTIPNADPNGLADSKATDVGGDPTIVFATGVAGASDFSLDTGFYSPTQICGTVYVDANGNGRFDPGEAPLSSVSIRLTGTDSLGSPVDLTVLTGQDGSYCFRELSPGLYTLTETQPAGYLSTATTVGSQGGQAGVDVVTGIVLTAGTNGQGNDFGEALPAGVSGTVFVDQNGDATYQPGEPTLAGSTVVLTGQDGMGRAVSRTVVTGVDGTYAFENLLPGGYRINRTLPPGYATAPNGPSSYDPVPLTSGQRLTNRDFPAVEAVDAALRGFVYYDLNHNGVMDEATDFGIAGVRITLDGVDDQGQAVRAETFTDAMGAYAFEGLRPGRYSLTETQPRYFRDYVDNVGSLGGIATNDRFSEISLTSGAVGVDYNFGELQRPNCRLRKLAIHVGRLMNRLTRLRDRNPEAFDQAFPILGPMIARGEVPRGIGPFPL
ncbi:MAG: SdrD B-like domain-containing protein, partial [Isosphaeraceae bacterium]